MTAQGPENIEKVLEFGSDRTFIPESYDMGDEAGYESLNAQVALHTQYSAKFASKQAQRVSKRRSTSTTVC